MKTIIRYQSNIPAGQAREKILVYAKHGNHYHEQRPTTWEEVKRFYRDRGIDPIDVAKQARNPNYVLPHLENLLPPAYDVFVENGTITHEDLLTGEKKTINESGVYTDDVSADNLRSALAAFDRTLANSNRANLMETVSLGISSLGTFFIRPAAAWNNRNSQDQLIDNPQCRTSLETKLQDWLPKLSGGYKLDKTQRIWSDFKTIKKLRDSHAVHPTESTHFMSYKEIAKNLNAFKHGISKMLLELHIKSGLKTDRTIINAAFAPDVEIIETDG